MTDQALNDPSGDVFARLAAIPVPVMTDYLVIELPQTVAAILLLLPQERAAAILKGLPPRVFQSVVRRMARSEAMFPAARTILAKVLEHEFLRNGVRETPDRDEEMRRLIALMSPERRDAAMAALEPPAETPRKPASPPPPYSWPDFTVPPNELTAESAHDAEESDDPLPLLLPVYDRFVRMLSTTMRTVTGLNAEITLDRLSCIGHGDYLNRVPLPAVFVPFIADGGGYCGLLAASPVLFFEVVDALLGGTVGVDMTTAPRRPFTTIERNLFELALDAMIDDLSAAFEVVGSVSFRAERTETNPRFALIAPPEAPMIYADLRIEFAKGGGKFHLLLLDSALDPLREILSQHVIAPVHQPKPTLVAPTDGGLKLKLATPPAERRTG